MSRKYLDNTGLSYFWNKVNGKKQDTLVSGTNIKTINNQSLLGSGNITISGGGGSATDVRINNTSITSNGVANITTNSTYDENNNPLATIDDVIDQGYQTASDVYEIIDDVASSQEFIQQLIQIISSLMPSGTELEVNTFEDLPTSNVAPYTKAYVKNATLYDVTSIADLNYDVTLMTYASPKEEMDFTGLSAQDYFSISYIDVFEKEFIVGMLASADAFTVMFGYQDALLDGWLATMYVYSTGSSQYFEVPEGWSLFDGQARAFVPITFNELPLVPLHLMSLEQTDGNPLLSNNFFVDAKKHWAGEYRYIDGEWKYQGTTTTPYFDSNINTVPSSKAIQSIIASLLDLFNDALTDIQTAIEDIYNQLGG